MLSRYLCMYIYIYIYMFTCICIYIYIYIHTYIHITTTNNMSSCAIRQARFARPEVEVGMSCMLAGRAPFGGN